MPCSLLQEEGLPSALSGGNAFNLLTRKGMFAHKPAHDHASMTDHYCAAMPWIKCNEIRCGSGPRDRPGGGCEGSLQGADARGGAGGWVSRDQGDAGLWGRG